MTPARAHLVLLLACGLWGSGNVAQRTILEHMGPLMATGLTCLLGELVLIPLALREGASKDSRPGVWEMATNLLYFAAAITLLQIGYAGTSVSNAGFLVTTCAVMTPVAAWFILRETPSIALVPSMTLVMTGV